MSSDRRILACFAVLCVLVLADIAVRFFRLRENRFNAQFAAVPLQTNGVSGILIKHRAKNQPLWGIWNFAVGDSENFFVDGKLVLGVTKVPEGRAETEVNFYGKDGRLISQWKARENGVFFMRTLYGEVGPRSEVWLNDTWHTIEMRTNQGKAEAGTILEGKWRRLITTNLVPALEN